MWEGLSKSAVDSLLLVLQAGALCVPLLRLSLLQLELISQVVSNKALVESSAASEEPPLSKTSKLALRSTKRAIKRVRLSYRGLRSAFSVELTNP